MNLFANNEGLKYFLYPSHKAAQVLGYIGPISAAVKFFALFIKVENDVYMKRDKTKTSTLNKHEQKQSYEVKMHPAQGSDI